MRSGSDPLWDPSLSFVAGGARKPAIAMCGDAGNPGQTGSAQASAPLVPLAISIAQVTDGLQPSPSCTQDVVDRKTEQDSLPNRLVAVA